MVCSLTDSKAMLSCGVDVLGELPPPDTLGVVLTTGSSTCQMYSDAHTAARHPCLSCSAFRHP